MFNYEKMLNKKYWKTK